MMIAASVPGILGNVRGTIVHVDPDQAVAFLLSERPALAIYPDNPPWPDGVWITTEHAASSRGLPVVVRSGVAYGSGDITGSVLLAPSSEATDADVEAIRRAGYRVEDGRDERLDG